MLATTAYVCPQRFDVRFAVIAERCYSFQKVESIAQTGAVTVGEAQISASPPSPSGAHALAYPALRGSDRWQSATSSASGPCGTTRPHFAANRSAPFRSVTDRRRMGKRNREPIAVLSISHEIAKAFGASHAM